LQGTDALGEGTFSGEDGGMIKAFSNMIVNADSVIYANSNAGTAAANATSFDAYLASTRSEAVPVSYHTLVGGTTYNNFDTLKDLGVNVSNIDAAGNVEQIVTSEAGRLNSGDFTWEFNDSVDDASDTLNSALMSKLLNYTTQLVSVGGNSSDPSTPPTDPADPIPTTIVHNFTTSGTTSDFFSIQGNLSTTKGTVIYDGLTLTQCLKIESSTLISFTTTAAQTLTLVFNSADGTEIKVDGTSNAMNNGIVTVSLAPGAHTITKVDPANLYFMKLE
jgi:hypothetical protein